ncbi:MAG: CrcB family protein [Planctomycetota bacterium]|nr:CrcB family protein [Planctomycetota bacterium]
MKSLILVLGIGLGGAAGSVSRHLVGYVCIDLLGMAPFIPTMIYNILGCFLIGLVYFLIEAIYNRDLPSRLVNTSMGAPLESRGWWPAGDPTAPVFREFEADLRAQFWSGVLITGFLGGLTTFSLFSLITLQLLQGGHHLFILISIVGSILAGFIATYLGLKVGQLITLARHRATEDAVR